MTVVSPHTMTVGVFFDGLATEPRLDHPEGLAIAPDGAVWCGGEAGQIYRIADGAIEQIACTGGFCLGMALDRRQHLYVCDVHHRAVFRLDTRTGQLERFADGAESRRLRSPNAVAIDAGGSVIVSDSGEAHVPQSGLFRFAPDGTGELWFEDPLDFANGIALAADGRTLFVVETWARRVLAIGVDASGRAGESRVVAELPEVVPDGVAVDVRGRLWVACYEPSQVVLVEPGLGHRVVAQDPDAHLLCHPTNLAFRGTSAIVTNLGRWHLSELDAGVAGVQLPPHQ